jgi:SAM-dependent methyltransferase
MTLDATQLQRAHFNRIADWYRDARSGGNHVVLRDLIWREVLSRGVLPADRTLRVMEPMCGYADGYEILSRYSARPIEYAGFDYSDRIVSELKAWRPDLDVVQADVTAYRPAPASADVVILIGGLHHVPDRAGDVVAALAPALSPGGLFVNFEPTNGNPLFRRIRERVYARNDLFEAQTERAFELDDYFAMFRRAGLERVDCIFPGLLSYVLYYNPDAFPALDVGGPAVVRAIFALERPWLRTRLAAVFSFATLSVWRRPMNQPETERRR